MDYYAVLGLETNCSDEEVKAQYRRLARLHHPDVNPGDEVESTARLREINQAYEVLSDPVKRRGYDLTIDTALPRPAPRQPQDPAPPYPAAPTPQVPRWNPYVGAVADARRRTERRTTFAAIVAGGFLVFLLSRAHIGHINIIPINQEIPDSSSNPDGDVLPLDHPNSADNSDEPKKVIVDSLQRTMNRMRPQISLILNQGQDIVKSSTPSPNDNNYQTELNRLNEDLAALQRADDISENDIREAQTLDTGHLQQSINRYRDDFDAVRTAGGNAARDIRELSPGLNH